MTSESTGAKSSHARRWLRDALNLSDADLVFPWQRELLDRFIQGRIDRCLDIPTGLGKTAVIAIWLVARACGAAVPRRLVYVVDRRAVVDQATRIAEEVRLWVDSEASVKEALGLTSAGRSLPISTLRGQFADNREWLHDPSLPAIVIGTVDMVGSRLLFEGYGTSRRMRPYQAALLGIDSLFVLDEAHLIPPFEFLLETIVGPEGAGLRGAAQRSELIPAPRLLSLSATSRDHGTAALRLSDDDRRHPVALRRLTAEKRLFIAPPEDPKDLPSAMAVKGWELALASPSPVRVLVFCDSRDHAEKAKAAVEKLAAGDKKSGIAKVDIETELFVGGRRVQERLAAARRLESLGFLAGSTTERTVHTFLFATSAGEVGVDLDADHSVADVVAWERMIQRLGRVNRRGGGVAHVHLVPMIEEGRGFDRNLVIELLQSLPEGADGSRNASPLALSNIQEATRSNPELADRARRASTAEVLRPALSRPLVDAWSMTSLLEHTGRPEVGPWLRGWDEQEPRTTLVWRRWLRPLSKKELEEEYFEAAPIHLNEKLETETHRALGLFLEVAKRRQLDLNARSGRDKGLEGSIAIVLNSAGEIQDRFSASDRRLVRPGPAMKNGLHRLLAGATLVLDAELGGLSVDGLIDPKSAEPVGAGDNDPPWSHRVIVAKSKSGGDADSVEDSGGEENHLPFRVRRVPVGWDPVPSGQWYERLRLPIEVDSEGEVSHWLSIERWRQDVGSEEGRSATPRPQSLSDHQASAAHHAEILANRLGLPSDLAAVIRIAARLHDEGKRSKRWQQAFNAPEVGRPYAKTRGPVNVQALGRYRHEFGSLPYAEVDEELQQLPEEQRDLALHLIAAHHGYARPIIRTDGGEDPPQVLDARAREVALRFVRLSESWGPWGLAYLESLLRAADQQASRANDESEDS